ncbi:hypothetical protein BH20BAC1_BH20BAC1_08650 [soil metagenome]
MKTVYYPVLPSFFPGNRLLQIARDSATINDFHLPSLTHFLPCGRKSYAKLTSGISLLNIKLAYQKDNQVITKILFYE